MRILVFEFMTGGGVADQHPLSDELKPFSAQGRSMLQAVCEDLLELGHDVVVPVDSNGETFLSGAEIFRVSVNHERNVDSVLLDAAVAADKILLIAPETDGCLEHFANLLDGYSNKFLSPGVAFIRQTANKWKCHNWLSTNNIPTPETVVLTCKSEDSEFAGIGFPCVAKPVDGAGSEEVRLIASAIELGSISQPMLLQRFVEGTAVSVSVVVESPDRVHYLEPGRQVFETEPFGLHVCTDFPLSSGLRERALGLAKNVVDASPNTLGYFGVDMVLAEDPSNDVVIEINPRLTTSYCFLREWSTENLARLFPLQ